MCELFRVWAPSRLVPLGSVIPPPPHGLQPDDGVQGAHGLLRAERRELVFVHAVPNPALHRAELWDLSGPPHLGEGGHSVGHPPVDQGAGGPQGRAPILFVDVGLHEGVEGHAEGLEGLGQPEGSNPSLPVRQALQGAEGDAKGAGGGDGLGRASRRPLIIVVIAIAVRGAGARPRREAAPPGGRNGEVVRGQGLRGGLALEPPELLTLPLPLARHAPALPVDRRELRRDGPHRLPQRLQRRAAPRWRFPQPACLPQHVNQSRQLPPGQPRRNLVRSRVCLAVPRLGVVVPKCSPHRPVLMPSVPLLLPRHGRSRAPPFVIVEMLEKSREKRRRAFARGGGGWCFHSIGRRRHCSLAGERA